MSSSLPAHCWKRLYSVQKETQDEAKEDELEKAKQCMSAKEVSKDCKKSKVLVLYTNILFLNSM